MKHNGAKTPSSKPKPHTATEWRRLRRASAVNIREGIEADPDAHPTDDEFWKNAKVVMPAPKEIVTMRLDADLLREARVLAAEEDTSISALLASRLEQIVRERKAYNKARQRALARLSKGMDLRWSPPRSREELHER